MSYIYRNLLADEEVLFFTKKHWIVFFAPIVLTIFSIVTASYMSNNPMVAVVPALSWLTNMILLGFTLILWAYCGLEYWASEYAVTNRRIMMREGFFYRHATEMRLSTISQVNIGQSLIGQLLGYGTVTINTFGAFDAFTLLAHPDTFERKVNEQLDKVTQGR